MQCEWTGLSLMRLLDLWIQHWARTNMQPEVTEPDSWDNILANRQEHLWESEKDCLQKLANPLTHCMNWNEAALSCQMYRRYRVQL